ncbi:MAG: cobalamin-binding protein [bacterium]
MSRAAVIAVACLSILACGSPEPPERRQIILVSLIPSVTETIYALGAGDRLVGNTTSCDWPEAARRVRKVGSFYQPDVEHIVGLRPDVVFLALPVHAPVVEKLAELGISYHVSDPHSLDALLDDISAIGRAIGRDQSAEALVRNLRARLATLPSWLDTPGVFVELSNSPLVTAGRGTFLSDAVRLAGGRNVFDDIDRSYPVVSSEDVIRRNPGAILLAHPAATPAEVRSRLGWAGLAAVRSGQLIADIDENLLVRPGPRSVEGIELLGRRLHERVVRAVGVE